MSRTFEEASNRQPLYVFCPACQERCYVDDVYCPYCGESLDNPTQPITVNLDRRPPSLTPVHRQDTARLEHNHSVLLQFLPSGTCVPLPLETATMLGRGLLTDVECALDLNEFNGYEHGVSRHHCLLERRGTQLVITDLNSRNGTFLNGVPLPPFEEHIMSDGDKLIVGSLHIIVTFSSL
jgi:hypothetical protein